MILYDSNYKQFRLLVTIYFIILTLVLTGVAYVLVYRNDYMFINSKEISRRLR